ncbi:uncharacterized protein LOC144745759 [Ciona intestinalis]
MSMANIKLAISVVLACFVVSTSAVGKTCDSTEPCKCLMSDGTGEINIRSIARTDGMPKFTLPTDGYWSYSYNPCVAFNSTKYTGLAVVQINSNNPAEEYDLGVQANEKFDYKISQGVYVEYQAGDYVRQVF